MRRALMIVNPTAGEGRPLDVAEDARRYLEEAGWEVRTLATARAGHAEELAREHSEGFDRVVVVGGDGTLRETVVGLPSATLPVALIPIGKANVVARDLGIPRTPNAAIRALTSERVRPIDVGRVGDSIFLAMVGIGYDGWVTAGVARVRSTRLGAWLYRHGGSSLVYFLAGLPALMRLFPCRPRVTVDGERVPGRFPLLVISNTETYALGWAMAPGADPHDGWLDHQLNRGAAPWFVLGTLAAAILRRPVPAWLAAHGRGRRYSVRADTPFRWQVDGDPMPPTRSLNVEIVPGYARMVIPERTA